MENVFEKSFEYMSEILVPLFCIAIVGLADEIFMLAKRSVMAAKLRSRRR